VRCPQIHRREATLIQIHQHKGGQS